MIDIHSHILPFVDDGCSMLEDSMHLLEHAIEQAVTDIIMTPHYRQPYFPEKDNLKTEFEKFKNYVKDKGLNINLYLGEEIYLSKNYKDLLKQDKVLTLNGTKYVLVEFNICTDFEMTEAIYSLVKLGYKPVVAHFERYTFVDVSIASEIKNIGGLIQVNSGAIVERLNFKAKRRVKKLFEKNLVDFVASDAHRVRKYSMRKAYDLVEKKYGKEIAEKVFYLNAKEIINSQTV